MLKILSNLSVQIIVSDEAYKKRISEEKEREDNSYRNELEVIYGSCFPNDWMKRHVNDYLTGKYHGFISEPSSYAYTYDYDYCNIYFYEYSSVDGNQKKFTSRRAFFKFCEDCHINVDKEIRSVIKNTYQIYITCFPGKSELMLSTTYAGLKENLKRYDKISHSLSVVEI